MEQKSEQTKPKETTTKKVDHGKVVKMEMIGYTDVYTYEDGYVYTYHYVD